MGQAPNHRSLLCITLALPPVDAAVGHNDSGSTSRCCLTTGLTARHSPATSRCCCGDTSSAHTSALCPATVWQQCWDARSHTYSSDMHTISIRFPVVYQLSRKRPEMKPEQKVQRPWTQTNMCNYVARSHWYVAMIRIMTLALWKWPRSGARRNGFGFARPCRATTQRKKTRRLD
jgi:hypothetical protein